MDKFLIVGLGNIGAEYQHTRHNIGFDVVEAFAKKHEANWQINRLAEVARVKLKGRTVVLIKPTTYMNLSGRAFKFWADAEKITIENTFTIVDDLALPIEKIRIRPAGTHAGHNGLRDIQLVLNSDVYPKLRFGIGNQFAKGRQVDFVLSKWTSEEMPIINQKIDTSVTVIETFVLAGIEKAMNEFNRLNFKIP